MHRGVSFRTHIHTYRAIGVHTNIRTWNVREHHETDGSICYDVCAANVQERDALNWSFGGETGNDSFVPCRHVTICGEDPQQHNLWEYMHGFCVIVSSLSDIMCVFKLFRCGVLNFYVGPIELDFFQSRVSRSPGDQTSWMCIATNAWTNSRLTL